MNKAIELDPGAGNYYSDRGDAHRKNGDLQSRLWPTTVRKAIELNTDDAVAWNNRGFTKKKMGDLPGALADFNEAIDRKVDPEFFQEPRPT